MEDGTLSPQAPAPPMLHVHRVIASTSREIIKEAAAISDDVIVTEVNGTADVVVPASAPVAFVTTRSMLRQAVEQLREQGKRLCVVCWEEEEDDEAEEEEEAMVVGPDSAGMLVDSTLWEVPDDECVVADVCDNRLHRVSVTPEVYVASQLGAESSTAPAHSVLSLLEPHEALHLPKVRRHLRVDMSDDPEADGELLRVLGRCFAFLDACSASSSGAVVHCRAGVSRSAAVAAAFLAKAHRTTPEAALQVVQDARPWTAPNPALAAQLTAWGKARLSPESLPALHFAPQFVPLILEGNKRATTRRCAPPAISPGSLVAATSGPGTGTPFALIYITGAVSSTPATLMPTTAAAEGYDTPQQLVSVLEQFYPGLKDDDLLIVYDFVVVESLPVDQH